MGSGGGGASMRRLVHIHQQRNEEEEEERERALGWHPKRFGTHRHADPGPELHLHSQRNVGGAS